MLQHLRPAVVLLLLFSIGTPSACDSRARRPRSATIKGSPALAIARTCFSNSFRASAFGKRGREHLYRALGLKLEEKNWSRTSNLNSESDSRMRFARDIQRKRAAGRAHDRRRRHRGRLGSALRRTRSPASQRARPSGPVAPPAFQAMFRGPAARRCPC